MPITRVLVDANVLYSKTLREWLALLYLRQEDEIYSVYRTEDVLAETIHRLRRHHPHWNGGKRR
jgi:predicted nucleic acid-binding protein